MNIRIYCHCIMFLTVQTIQIMSHWQIVVEYWPVAPTHLDNWVLVRESHTLQIYWLLRWGMQHDKSKVFIQPILSDSAASNQLQTSCCTDRSQSLKEPVVSVAAGLRHSLAVTGKFGPKSLFSFSCKSTNSNFLSCLQTQAVCISGEAVSSVTLRGHSVHSRSHHTSTLRCLLWYQVSENLCCWKE